MELPNLLIAWILNVTFCFERETISLISSRVTKVSKIPPPVTFFKFIIKVPWLES
jgi:hypothetical protein